MSTDEARMKVDGPSMSGRIIYIGKPPALPEDSKSLTAPYFETLRNAEKGADKRRFVRRGSASKSR
jgi:hypothetical protein